MLRAASVLLLSLAAGSVYAQGRGDRGESWEVGVSVFNATEKSLTGQGGSAIDLDSDIGFGAAISYNVSNRFAVGAELNWSEPDYTATLPFIDTAGVATIDAELSGATVLFKGVFYVSESDFSPYLELGVGWTRIDSNIAQGPPATECWWDPWWGYVCDDFFDTYHDTRATYLTALGVRWDVNPDTLVKVSWGLRTIDSGDRTEELSQDVFRAEFGWKF